MTNTYTIVWVFLCVLLIATIILREPNVESVGAIIQESQFQEVESEKKVDKIISLLFLIFIIVTIFLFIQYS
jgi:protein translocase SecG subunit